MKNALKQLLDALDDVYSRRHELGDTAVREAMHEAIRDAFVVPQAGYKLPDDFGMFSDEGNKEVHTVISAFLAHPDVAAAAKKLKTPRERLDAFQDIDVASDDGSTHDVYFGYADSL